MVDTIFYNHKGNKTIKEIAEITNAVIATDGCENELIANVCSIESAGSEDICFFYDKKNKDRASNIRSKACVTIKELQHLGKIL